MKYNLLVGLLFIATWPFLSHAAIQQETIDRAEIKQGTVDFEPTGQQTVKNNSGTAINAGRDVTVNNSRTIINQFSGIDKITLNTDRGKKAKVLYEERKYQEALVVLDDEEMDYEKRVVLASKKQLEDQLNKNKVQRSDLATEYVLKAKLIARDPQLGRERVQRAQKIFEKALSLDKTPERQLEYAAFLQNNNKLSDAEELYRKILPIYRTRTEEDFDNYATDLVGIFIRLGVLVGKGSTRWDKADEYYREALAIYQKLVKKDPDFNQIEQARILYGLGALAANNSTRQIEAEKYHREALRIYRQLAEKDPDSYQSDLAGVLNNLGLLLANDRMHWPEAEKYYCEALAIYRKLAGARRKK
ncbi:tetratricopeptide repeat protein [Nitrosomonas sp.]|uniref:tetratricopeptide repeat protein n=1 Tax=Nitrosomonas sp. TaxID=42353 RepID=UPI0025E6AFC9|nr:tetratricopeptide repeat protein [Nitrosomonas sp.]